MRPPSHEPWWKPTRYSLLIAFGIVLALGMCEWIWSPMRGLYRQILPDVGILEKQYPVFAKKEGRRNIYRFIPQKPAHWRHLHEISGVAVSAVLLSEDAGFFQHKGFEPESIKKAVQYNIKAKAYKKGGSTITQQVVKNLFLSPDKTLTRKVRELFLAVEMERRFPKRKILETYLNIAEWGPGTYGIEAASQRYFHKSASALSAREGATLAFMLPNPGKYRHSIRDYGLSEFGQDRVETIMERLWKTGRISREQIDSEETSPEDSDELPSEQDPVEGSGQNIEAQGDSGHGIQGATSGAAELAKPGEGSFPEESKQ